jgi:release factor glutamine methyltransferase
MTDASASNLAPSLAHALRDAAAQLAAVSETARLDAELIAAHAIGMERMTMLSRMHDLSVPNGFAAMIARRMAHEPVAYITGRQAFWDIELSVTPDVLIPRADSETLIEAAQGYFKDRTAPRTLLDLGTGSGALPAARGVGIDASPAALAVARGNAEALGFADRSEFLELSWLDNGWTEQLNGPFDLILCNPPYVEEDAALDPMVADYEPHAALFAGADGMDDYRVLIPALPALLTAEGLAVIEIGHEQGDAVITLAKESGLSAEIRHDLAGKPRCVMMKRAQ